MKNNEYNTLTDMLIQSGIIKKEEENPQTTDINFFNVENSNIENEPKNTSQTTNTIKRKRLNNYDLELLEKADTKIKFENETKIQKILYKFFPKLYEFKIAKDAIQKMSDMGIDPNYLLNKTVPYGEGELRYKKLAEFIKYANEIQTKLKRKTGAK